MANWQRTEAKQLATTNENLTEEGKRLEVALRYVTQVNGELLDQLAAGERRMADLEAALADSVNLRLVNIPNGQSVEKMSEALLRDYGRLRKDLHQRSTELGRLHRDRLFSDFNEKAVELAEFSAECQRMKKLYEDLRNQTAEETAEQESQRILRNIGRLKGQIKELLVKF